MISKLFESRFEKLLQKHADNALTATETQELQSLCSQSAQRAQFFAEYTKILAALKALPQENAPSQLRRNVLMRLEKRRASLVRLQRLERTFFIYRYPVEISIVMLLAGAVGVLFWLLHA